MDNFKSEKITFDDDVCELFAEIIQQEIVNVKVLFYIVQCHKTSTPVTVKSITDNVSSIRRAGIKDSKNNLVSFSNVEGNIDRKTAEKIVDRLAYASLIYFDVQRPHKFIKLTTRGVQVAINIRKKIGGN